jgi:hypothetical protein
MPPQRPTSVTVIAVLQIVFGSLCLISVLAGTALQGQQGGQQDDKRVEAAKRQEEEIEKRLPSYKLITQVATGVTFALHLAMLLSGVGLLLMARWGRTTALLWAWAFIVLTLASLALRAAVAFSALDEVQHAYPEEVKFLRLFLILVLAFSMVFLIYPVIVLIVLARPHVKAAFAGQEWGAPPPRQEPEDYYDRPEDRPPHRPGDQNIQP